MSIHPFSACSIIIGTNLFPQKIWNNIKLLKDQKCNHELKTFGSYSYHKCTECDEITKQTLIKIMKGILYIGTTYSIGRSLDKLYNSGFLEDIYRENQLNLIMGMHHYPPWRSARINGLIKCLLAIACHYYYHTKKGTKLDIILLSIYLTKKILFQSDDLLLFQKIIESM